ncbi:MAG: hypothetical protein JNL40_14835 [Cyclobacteriaceae bacterium]|nr:hypothetical protein [Cyclobacteriaceae bacterium]
MKRILLIAVVLLGMTTLRVSAQTVYASDKGEKYHTADCNLSGDAKDMTLASAKKAGKGPCSICKPNDHFKDQTVRCSGKTADGTRCKRMTANKAGKCYQHKGS